MKDKNKTKTLDLHHAIVGAAIIKIGVPCLICLGLCAAGIASGVILQKKFFSFHATDYDAFNIEDYEDDINPIIKKYQAMSPDKYATNLKSYEIANIGLYNARLHDNVKSVGVGEVIATMGIKQTIRSYYQKSHDEYFFENISKSQSKMVNVSVNKRFYQKDDKVDTYLGDGPEIDKATWRNSPDETLNLADFEEKWGRNLTRNAIYIISSKTTFEEQSSIQVDGDNIKINLVLDPETSVLRYIKQMKWTSDLKQYPVFHQMNIEMTLDKNLNLLTSITDEIYDVQSFGVTSKGTKTSMKEKIIYDVDEKVPDLSTNCDYSEGEKLL